MTDTTDTMPVYGGTENATDAAAKATAGQPPLRKYYFVLPLATPGTVDETAETFATHCQKVVCGDARKDCAFFCPIKGNMKDMKCEDVTPRDWQAILQSGSMTCYIHSAFSEASARINTEITDLVEHGKGVEWK